MGSSVVGQVSRPHVVHVLHSLGVGGTENGVVNLVTALHQEWRHTVISMTGVCPLADRLPAGVEVYSVGKRPGTDLRMIVRLTRLLHGLRPDLVHTRNWGGFDGILAARLARIPVVIHGEHGREANDPEGRNRRRNRLRRLLSPLVDRFVAVSSDLRRWLVGTVGIPERKVVTICNGVDTHRFTGEDRESARRAMGIVDGRLVIGTVGRLDPVKDQAALLTAFAQVRGRHPEALLLVVGDGPSRSELEARAGALDLGPSIRFLGESKEIPRLLRGMDVFVLPSIAEGISNTILEAMATGLPIIATRVGGNPELVQDGVTGTLVSPRDPRGLGDAIAGYLEDAPRREVHGRAARRHAVERFALDRMVAAYSGLYLELIRSKGLVS